MNRLVARGALWLGLWVWLVGCGSSAASPDVSPTDTEDTSSEDVAVDSSSEDATAEDTVSPPDALATDTFWTEDGVGLREPPPLSNARLVSPGDGLGTVRVQPAFAWVEAFRLVTAWTGDDGEGGLGIWVSTFETAGATITPFGPAERLNTDTRGIQNEPSACTTHNGQAVVVWSVDTQETGPDGENLELRFRRLDSAGAPLDDTDQRVLTDRPGNHWLGRVACLGSGGFAVAGVRPGDPSLGFEVFVQRFTVGGDPAGGAIIPAVAAFGQGFPDVASNDFGEIFVAFEDTLTGGAYTTIEAGRVYPTPGPLRTVAGLVGDNAMRASVSVDHRSQRFVAAGTVGTQTQLRLFDSDSDAPVELGLAEAPAAVVTNAVLEPLGDGRHAVVYFRGTGGAVDVRLAYLAADGAVTADTTVATGSFPLAYRPTLTYRFGYLAVGWTESLGGGQYRVVGAVYSDQP